MKASQWIFVFLCTALIGFYGGYSLSARTGTEPGYFGAVEAAGYGGGGEAIEGVTDEMQEYYKNLLQDE